MENKTEIESDRDNIAVILLYQYVSTNNKFIFADND